MENDNYVDEFIVSPSGELVAGTLRALDSLVVVVDSRTRTILAKIKAARALVFIPSPSGHENYILTITGQSFRIWDYLRGTHVTLDLPSGYSELNEGSLREWKADISKKFFFAWSSAGTLLVWKTQSRALVHTYRNVPLSKDTPGMNRNVVYVSLNERWLLAHNYDSIYEISVWDTATWTLHAILSPNADHENTPLRIAVAFTEGETSIVAICHCGVIQKCDFLTGRLHNTYLVDSAGSPVSELYKDLTQLSPNGHWICWAKSGVKGNQIVNMSDANTGALLWSVGSLSPYLKEPKRIFFSRYGPYVAAEYWGCVLRVLRVEDGECVATESMGSEGAFSRFARDGKVLIVDEWEELLGAVRIIDL